MKKTKDKILYCLTYSSSVMSVLVLLCIFMFIFHNGSSTLSWDFIKNHFWSETMVGVLSEEASYFKRPPDLVNEAIWSEKWGIGFVNVIHEDKNLILVEHLHEDSPFQSMTSLSLQEPLKIQVGMNAERFKIIYENEEIDYMGSVLNEDVETFVLKLDQAKAVENAYFKTIGGGIVGSIKTTLLLIVVALVISIPIGIGSAIYLNEYLYPSKFKSLLRSSIEMLSGVPSIIFSLMGITLLYPITQIFGANSTSILLGGMTLSIIILPIIIRNCEEAFINVPQGLRDASLSLGATQAQTIWKVVLPYASFNIFNSILLCIARIVGESAALIYTMGTFINDSPNLLSPGTSLALHIYNLMSGETIRFDLACSIAIVILIIILLLQIMIRCLSYVYQKKVS